MSLTAAIIINVLLQQLGLPVPAAPALIFGGALASRHQLSGLELFVLAIAACLLGDSLWFSGGRVYGARVMRLICRLSLSPDSCLRESQLRFERWGNGAVLIAKFVPGLSRMTPALAGAMRMSWPRFIALSTLGATLWVSTYLLLGAMLTPQIDRLVRLALAIRLQAVLIAAVLLSAYIALKWWQRRRLHAKLRMARIEVAELRSLMQLQPAPVVLDVRSATARSLDARSIPGARHVPPDDVATHLEDLEPDRDLIVYCNCPNEASAARIAKLLINQGFTRVRPLAGGLDAWAAAGYPLAPL